MLPRQAHIRSERSYTDHSKFPYAQGHVHLRPTDVVADGQADLDAPDVVCHQAISRRVVLLIASRAHALIVAIRDPTLRVDQVQAIGRLGLLVQEMGGKVNASVLAGGIWEAMLTTALGLGVALPTIVAHSYLLSRVERYEAELQDGTVTFLKALAKRS